MILENAEKGHKIHSREELAQYRNMYGGDLALTNREQV